MTTAVDPSLLDRYLRDEGSIYLSGVQALVRVLFDRVRIDRQRSRTIGGFISGYEGSPLGGFDLELGRRSELLAAHGLVHQPGLNEELAATSVFGTQTAGVARLRTEGIFGAWYGKAPGLDRASDALRHANLAGTDPSGGAVAFVGDDPAAKSSSVPSASEHTLADLAIPVLFPSDPQDVIDFGRHAIELSRASGLWSALKVVANVADSSSSVTVHPEWTAPKLEGAYQHVPNSRMLGAQLTALERSLYEVRLPLAMEYIRASGLNAIHGDLGATAGVIAAGHSFLDVQEALRTLGLSSSSPKGVKLLKLGAIYPIDPVIVREFAKGLTEIVVVEEKRGMIEREVKEILYGTPDAPRVHGKDLFPTSGIIEPDRIASTLAQKIPGAVRPPVVHRSRIVLPLVSRTPYFCSGCPHNSSTKVPEGSLVGGGIGCHTMVLFQSPEQVGDVTGITQMGGEGAQWIGMSHFVETGHWVQNIGDGTFWHSGSLAIRAAVAANVNITYKLLHNSAVAMTGGQDAIGSMPLPELTRLLATEGVRRVVVTSDDPSSLKRLGLGRDVTVRDRRELVAVQEELAAVPGVTVLIHDQECATEVQRKRRRGVYERPATRVAINRMVCEGCGDCGVKSNCLSVRPIDTEFGRKTTIHQASCALDSSCVEGECPSFLSVVPSQRRPDRTALTRDNLPAAEVRQGEVAVRIAGVGGTGVVTVSQILATAAYLAGKHVRTLDQTGLAQKGGGVVSDIRIADVAEPRSAKVAAGGSDLYLAADLLVAADPQNLRAADPARTIAVVATAEVPTGDMVTGRAAFPDSGGVHNALAEMSRDAYFFDPHGIAETYCGSDQYANVVLLGMAFQLGLLPVDDEAIESAIRLNGTAVEQNIQAFRRGRQAAVPSTQPEAAPDERPTTTEDEVDRLVRIRVDELTAYQDARYAQRYADFIEEVRSTPGGEGAVAEAVARQLHRLMAYKDEYEVARLSLDPRLAADLEQDFGPDTKVRYVLKPPVLTWFGLRRKVTVGPWFRVVFALLRTLRFLRGTPCDVFGYTRVRRRERQLVEEYIMTIRDVLRTASHHPVLLELAELPEQIRGYDSVKLAGIAAYDQKRLELLEQLRRPLATSDAL